MTWGGGRLDLGRKDHPCWGHRAWAPQSQLLQPEASSLGCDCGIPTRELKGREGGREEDARTLPFPLLSLVRRASGEDVKGRRARTGSVTEPPLTEARLGLKRRGGEPMSLLPTPTPPPAAGPPDYLPSASPPAHLALSARPL